MAIKEPLLDTEWLLGSADGPGPWRRRFFLQASVVLVLVAIGVGLWPTLSKSWIQNELIQQYHQGESTQSRNEAMISLAELLPDSLPVVISGLAKPLREESNLAFQALDYYIGQLTTLTVEQRRGCFAELIHGLEEISPHLSSDSAPLATALATRIIAVQQADQHPGTQLTLAACRRIVESHQSPSKTAFAKLTDTNDSALPVQPHAPVTMSLSDGIAEQAQESIDSTPHSTHQDIAAVDNTTAPIRMSLKSTDDEQTEPGAFSDVGVSNATASSGQLRQKLLRANRFVPVTGLITVPIHSNVNANTPIETATVASTHETIEPLPPPASTTNRGMNAHEEVLGMERQETPYLLTLLGSVTPRLASAAFHELRNRLSARELDMAIELAQGTSEQRIAAMERLAKESDINPIEWLAWMGSEADHEVRFKAVSLLGSINNEDARIRLRRMLGRERDAGIVRHIQGVLLSSGSFKPQVR